MLDELVAVII